MKSTKVCFKCGKRKRLTSFYRHGKMGDGRLGKCKECTKMDVRIHRRNNIEKVRAYDRERNIGARKARVAATVKAYTRRFPGRKRATTAVDHAIRDGKLIRMPCEVCGRPDSHGHHDDYRKPLAVRWLCPPHHAEAHGRNKPIKATP